MRRGVSGGLSDAGLARQVESCSARPEDEGAARPTSESPGFVGPSMDGGESEALPSEAPVGRPALARSELGTIPTQAVGRALAALTERQAGLVAELAEVDAEIAELSQDEGQNAAITLASQADPSVMGGMPTPQLPSLSAPPSRPAFLTVNDVAKRLQVLPQTIRRWRSAGKLPAAITLGGVIRWRAETVDAWMATQEAGGSR
jgi:excisionase family DNA binding protein